MIPLRPLFVRLRAEVWPLAGLGLACLLVLVLFEIAEELHEGEILRFDRSILVLVRGHAESGIPIGPSWLPQAATELTALGSVTVLSLLTVAATGFLALTRKWRAALLLLLAVIGGALLTSLLKEVVDRPRPVAVFHLVAVASPSFPSGHAAISAATYLTVGALMARLSERKRVKAYFIGAAVLLTLLIGLTRIYLGVHFPSDVIAGWCLGSAWALLVWLAAYWLGRRGTIEAPAREPAAKTPNS